MPASTSAIAGCSRRAYLLARHCLGPNAYKAEQVRLFSAGTPWQASNQGVANFLRADLVAQGTAAKLLSGRQAVLGNRPDLEFYKEKESELLAELQAIAPQYRTRPSMLGPLFSALGFGTGAVTALLPRNLQGAVAAAVQEALQEQYNDQLRELATAKEGHVKDLLKRLRDADRIPTDVKVPDLAMLQRPQELTLEEGVAGVVKMAFSGLIGLTLRV